MLERPRQGACGEEIETIVKVKRTGYGGKIAWAPRGRGRGTDYLNNMVNAIMMIF